MVVWVLVEFQREPLLCVAFKHVIGTRIFVSLYLLSVGNYTEQETENIETIYFNTKEDIINLLMLHHWYILFSLCGLIIYLPLSNKFVGYFLPVNSLCKILQNISSF